MEMPSILYQKPLTLQLKDRYPSPDLNALVGLENVNCYRCMKWNFPPTTRFHRYFSGGVKIVYQHLNQRVQWSDPAYPFITAAQYLDAVANEKYLRQDICRKALSHCGCGYKWLCEMDYFKREPGRRGIYQGPSDDIFGTNEFYRDNINKGTREHVDRMEVADMIVKEYLTACLMNDMYRAEVFCYLYATECGYCIFPITSLCQDCLGYYSNGHMIDYLQRGEEWFTHNALEECISAEVNEGRSLMPLRYSLRNRDIFRFNPLESEKCIVCKFKPLVENIEIAFHVLNQNYYYEYAPTQSI